MEYTLRYDRVHLSWTKLNKYLNFTPKNIPDGIRTPQPQCMPDYCKTEKDVIKAYRNYYINEKSRFAVWKHASQPDWYNEGVKNANIRL